VWYIRQWKYKLWVEHSFISTVYLSKLQIIIKTNIYRKLSSYMNIYTINSRPNKFSKNKEFNFNALENYAFKIRKTFCENRAVKTFSKS